MYKKILLPADGSNYAEKAAEYVKWIAKSFNSEILVLNVFETSSLNPFRSKKLKKAFQEGGEQKLEGVLKILENEGLKIKTQIKEGRPADVILKTIEDENIDRVVIGFSWKNSFDWLLKGRAAEKVIRAAQVPVMIIH